MGCHFIQACLAFRICFGKGGPSPCQPAAIPCRPAHPLSLPRLGGQQGFSPVLHPRASNLSGRSRTSPTCRGSRRADRPDRGCSHLGGQYLRRSHRFASVNPPHQIPVPETDWTQIRHGIVMTRLWDDCPETSYVGSPVFSWGGRGWCDNIFTISDPPPPPGAAPLPDTPGNTTTVRFTAIDALSRAYGLLNDINN